MKRFCFSYLLTLIVVSLSAQNFIGRVVDEQNNGVSYASVYIAELMRGFTADDEGRFQVQLPIGSYQCEISSLGFMPRRIELNMTQAEIGRAHV